MIAKPTYMHINEGFRRKGIATAIMRFAKTVFDDVYFEDNPGYGSKNSVIYYSEEGAALKKYCEEKGITERRKECEN